MPTTAKFLFRTVCIAVTFASPLALAQESKFPAADFKPEVVFRNADLIKASEPASSAGLTKTMHDPKYPAADFEPVVLMKAAAAAVKETPYTPDPKYPAAYFNPSVVVPAQ